MQCGEPKRGASRGVRPTGVGAHPVEVSRVAPVDGSTDYLWDVVRVGLHHRLGESGQEGSPRLDHQEEFFVLVHLALPPVPRLHTGKDVHTGRELRAQQGLGVC